MMTSREYFEQILEWHKHGQKDMIRQSAKMRSQANRAIAKSRLFVDEEALDKEENKE